MKIQRIVKGLLLAACVLSFVTVAGCAPTSRQEGTGEYLDDSVITTKVKAAILNDSELKVLQINVETFKGVVQLSGFVDSRAMINRAVEVTRGVSGVKRTVCVRRWHYYRKRILMPFRQIVRIKIPAFFPKLVNPAFGFLGVVRF